MARDYRDNDIQNEIVFESCCYHNAIIGFGLNRVDA